MFPTKHWFRVKMAASGLWSATYEDENEGYIINVSGIGATPSEAVGNCQEATVVAMKNYLAKLQEKLEAQEEEQERKALDHKEHGY